jgi:hypothetical protein
VVKTDGTGLRAIRSPAGIHYAIVLRSDPVAVSFSLVEEPYMRLWDMKDGSWTPLPYRMSHQVWGPKGEKALFTHGLDSAGGYWGMVTYDRHDLL